ncbi:meiosis protein SPO22/ZIP4 like-domain-containing protein [Glomus cerebriforme]|uniref:Protein ZIP4 homolog n=1 Tax=Glomus cerebriforme TaxID=658196 RepID=A0A397SB06_9GLOM|nr:meiosis protein SPO22/ZIP4 like-domain-containing protein [Glomus cerebriforme]
MFKRIRKSTKSDTPFFLTFNGKRVSVSPTLSEDNTFSLNSNAHISEKADPKARLKKQLEIISALVKDVHEKINKNPLDTKFIQDSLKEILRGVEQFTNLQKVAQDFELSDEIDEIGVGLWNSSIALKTISDSRGTDELIALIRQVGFAMIQAGASDDSEKKSTVKLLALASKVGKAWLDCGRSDQADDVLRSVDEIEDSVLSLQNKTAKEQHSKATTLLVYYAYRAEAAWKLANIHVANLMFQHATASREGKTNDAIKWLRKCHELLTDGMPVSIPERTKLLTNTLNILANCYLKNIVYDESNLDLAENAVNLCLEEDPSNALATLLKLKIMKQKNFNLIQFEEVYVPFIRNSQITKENLKILLNVTHFISEINIIIALRGMDILIEEKLADMRNVSFVEKAIISKFHMFENGDSINPEINDIIHSIEVTLGFEQRHGIVIGHRTKVACQLILWQNGDRDYSNQNYERAKQWYIIAYKWLTSNQTNSRNAAILQRKIALCYLEMDTLADAIEAVHKSQLHEHNSAANFYILYHIAMEKRQNDQAIRYLSDMCKGDGFNGNMLAMAAHEAYKKENKEVLIETLQEILKKHKNGESIANINILVLLRCLIRMIHGSLSNNDAEKNSLKERICDYFEMAFILNNTMIENEICQTKKVPLNDFEWFFKTAWNIALGFCHQSDNGNDLYAVRLIEISHKKEILEHVLEKVEQYKKMKKILGKRKFEENDEQSTSQKDLMLVLLFEYEAKVKLGLWDQLQNVINATEAFDFELPSKIFERMVELLINESDCPSAIIFSVLQILLNSIMKHKQADIEQFSRWFRMLIITIMLKNKPSAAQYHDQVLDILNQECVKGKYPADEIQWLMVNAWNCGIDYYSANDFVQAKKWCETAIAFCRHINNGILYEEEMRKSYNEIIKNYDTSIIEV